MSGASCRAVWNRTSVSVLAAVVATASQLYVQASQQVAITWHPSPEPAIAGYRVYYGPASGNYTNVVVVGNVTNAVVAGLTAGRNYYFAATAYNLLGLESEFSNEAVFTAPAQCALGIINLASNGVTTAVRITASGAVPERWALQASSDLASWATLTRGTNSPVNVSAPISSAARRFFRLKSE